MIAPLVVTVLGLGAAGGGFYFYYRHTEDPGSVASPRYTITATMVGATIAGIGIGWLIERLTRRPNVTVMPNEGGASVALSGTF